MASILYILTMAEANVCTRGAKCVLFTCEAAHPAERKKCTDSKCNHKCGAVHDRPACNFDANCKKYGCKYYHTVERVLCDRPDCTCGAIHRDYCRNVPCTRENCHYEHRAEQQAVASKRKYQLCEDPNCQYGQSCFRIHPLGEEQPYAVIRLIKQAGAGHIEHINLVAVRTFGEMLTMCHDEPIPKTFKKHVNSYIESKACTDKNCKRTLYCKFVHRLSIDELYTAMDRLMIACGKKSNIHSKAFLEELLKVANE